MRDASAELHDDPKEILRYALYIIIGLAALYVVLGWVAEFTAQHIPDAWEKKISFKLPATPVDYPQKYYRASELFEKLVAQGATRNLDYRLAYVNESAPNAFAVPGGAVFVTKGLLDMLSTDAGIAFVLGHELGHHERRHVLRSVGRGVIIGLTVDMLFGSGLMGTIFGISELKFSRQMELEADQFGLGIVQKTLGTTDGVTEFFEALIATGLDQNTIPLLRSHPYAGERLEALKKIK